MVFYVNQISPDIELVFANSDKFINVYPSYHQIGGLNYRNVPSSEWEVVGPQYRWATGLPAITDESIPVIQLVYSFNATDPEQQQQYASFKSITSVETVAGNLYLYAPSRPSVNFRIRFKILNKLDIAVLLNRLFGIGIGYSTQYDQVTAMLTGFNPITDQSAILSGIIPEVTNRRAGVVAGGTLSRIAKLESIYNESLTQPYRIDGYSSAAASTPISTYYPDLITMKGIPASTWYKQCAIYTTTDATDFVDADNLFYQQQATGLDLQHVYTGNVTTLRYALAANSLLQEIKGLNLLDLHQVTDASYMFADDESLSEIDLGETCLDALDDITGMFSGCIGLQTLNLTSIDFTKVTSAGTTLAECPNIFQDVPDNCTIWVSGETQRQAILEQYPNLTGITYN